MRDILIKFLRNLVLKIEKLIDVLHSDAVRKKRVAGSSIWSRDIEISPKYLFYITGILLTIQNIFFVRDILHFIAFSAIIVSVFSFFSYAIYTISWDVRSSFSSALLVLFMLLVNIYAIFILETNEAMALFPSTAVVFLISLVYSKSVAMLFAIFSILISFIYMPQERWYYFAGYVISAFVAILFSGKINSRQAVLRAGIKISIVNFLIVALLREFYNIESNQLNTLFAAVSGIIVVLAVLFFLPYIETLFGVLSPISLVEMSDVNKPLLKQMMVDAPGTYHHSLVTASLAEAACDAIGASGQLARVGAYYHDIGKLFKPQYFLENQVFMPNPHDNTTPSMSGMVLMAHVKEGVDLARKEKINRRVIEFIQEHHGTSLLLQFYHKAIARNISTDERDYRYNCPKPRSKETAVVMLADSVEAASRSITSLKPAAISDVVRKVINNKFVDGQLNDSPLTLRDIEVISEVMTRVLCGVLHVRYQKQEKSDQQNQQNSQV